MHARSLHELRFLWGWDGRAAALEGAVAHVLEYVGAGWPAATLFLPPWDALLDGATCAPLVQRVHACIRDSLARLDQARMRGFASLWLERTMAAASECFDVLSSATLVCSDAN